MTPTPDSPVDAAPYRVTLARSGAGWWVAGGFLVGLAGLGAGQLVAELSSVRTTPLVALFRLIAGLSPENFSQATVEFLAGAVAPTLLGLGVAVVAMLFGVAGLLWRSSPWHSLLLWAALALAGVGISFAVSGRAWAHVWPGVAAFVVWSLAMAFVGRSLRRQDRSRESAAALTGEVPADADADAEAQSPRPGRWRPRRDVLRIFAAVTVTVLGTGGSVLWVERRRAAIDESRRLLRIPGVTRPRVPDGAVAGIEGVTPWQTDNDDFHVPSSSLRTPAVDASQWRLRIRGMVENPIELSYADLLERDLVEAWLTVASVRDEVDGRSVGNAWWSGVPTSVLLAAAGVRARADTVLQTGADGRSYATPLDALNTPGRAMLAVAMNGVALPIEHGFPVRTVVPGLYSEGGDCRWVVDWEVTTLRALNRRDPELLEQTVAPVKLASRIDVPRDGDRVDAGALDIGGVAWQPGTGIERVQYSLDGTEWRDAFVAHSDVVPVDGWALGTEGAWVQWGGRLRLEPGEHELRVRAINRSGAVQNGVRTDPLPFGAGGWHTVTFTAEERDRDGEITPPGDR